MGDVSFVYIEVFEVVGIFVRYFIVFGNLYDMIDDVSCKIYDLFGVYFEDLEVVFVVYGVLSLFISEVLWFIRFYI